MQPVMLTPGTTAGAGYLADGGGPPVLVLHAWWGLVRTVTDVCDRLSNAGFTAFGPDLYDGRTATTVAAATQLSGALDPEAATARGVRRPRAAFSGVGTAVGRGVLAGSLLRLGSGPRRATTGERLSATTARGRFRPGARPSSAILGHFAEIDDFEPSEWVTEVETALARPGPTWSSTAIPELGTGSPNRTGRSTTRRPPRRPGHAPGSCTARAEPPVVRPTLVPRPHT